MKNINEYFYIFSKLLTSLLLLFLVFVLGYLLFHSYKDVDQEETKTLNRIENIEITIWSVLKIIRLAIVIPYTDNEKFMCERNRENLTLEKSINFGMGKCCLIFKAI